eukprot:7595114-Prorocentrum_lima.AAC.1
MAPSDVRARGDVPLPGPYMFAFCPPFGSDDGDVPRLDTIVLGMSAAWSEATGVSLEPKALSWQGLGFSSGPNHVTHSNVVLYALPPVLLAFRTHERWPTLQRYS